MIGKNQGKLVNADATAAATVSNVKGLTASKTVDSAFFKLNLYTCLKPRSAAILHKQEQVSKHSKNLFKNI